jgi:hypothetical protein
MSGSIYNLIKENRKLFYTGVLRNKFKSEIAQNDKELSSQTIYTISPEQKEKSSFKSRSIDILQELFAE